MPAIVPPRDRTRTEHIAVVDRVVFTSPSRDFCILVTTEGHTVKGPGDGDKFPRGTTWKWFGRWEDDAARGPFFRFQTFVQHLGHGKAGTITYLTKSCEGVGEKTADKLWQKYGGDAVRTLREEPDRVAEECSLSPDLCRKAAVELLDAVRFESTRVELFGLFAGRGFPGVLIERAIERWDVRAPAKIKRNPFAMLGMPGAGFKRCDRMWTDLGLPKTALKRSGLCAWNLARNERNGNTWIPAEDLAAQLRDTIPGCDVKRSLRFAIRARRLKKHIDADGKVWLAVYHEAVAEERIARNIRRLAGGQCDWPTHRVPVSAVEGDGLPTAHQVGKLQQATTSPVGLFLGGPGCGKTHSVAYLLRAILEEYGRDDVAVAAPTGKAANRLTQSLAAAGISLTARTIHSTLGIGRNGHDGDGWQFDFNARSPMPVKFLFVDETSMCDTLLMADLLDAVPTGGHVLFIGDPGQLPPVGRGAPLRDLLAAGVSHGELTEVQRNAGSIVRACQAIKAGERFETDASIDLEAKPPRNLKLIEARDDAHAADILAETLRRLTRFHPVNETQVLVARNKGSDVARASVNERLRPMLNPDGYACGSNPFRVGDKVICTKNTMFHKVETFHESAMPEAEPGVLCGECGQPNTPGKRCWVCGAETTVTRDVAKVVNPVWDATNYQTISAVDANGYPTREPEELYVANGEIGRVVAVGQKIAVARFSEGSNLVKVLIGKQDDGDDDEGGRGCHMDHAYAVTCHRMQGSEAPCVIILGDERAGGIANREWIYTAISRASKLCVLIGKRSTFDRMAQRVGLNRRKTFLRELVREVLSPAAGVPVAANQ